MAPTMSPYTIPADVQVSYPDAAELLSVAKANVLAEFNEYEVTEWALENFDMGNFTQDLMDEKYPGWVDSLITNHILGIHKRENRLGRATTSSEHKGYRNGKVYEGSFHYFCDYFLILAARAAVRSDAREQDITVGLAGATSTAKLCSVTQNTHLLAPFQWFMITDGQPKDELDEDGYTRVQMWSIMQLVKHILLERARREGWELSPALKDIIADTTTLYVFNPSIISRPLTGPAYSSDTWMSVAAGEGVDPEPTEKSAPAMVPIDYSGDEDESPLPPFMAGRLRDILRELSGRDGELELLVDPSMITRLMGRQVMMIEVDEEVYDSVVSASERR